MDANDSTLSVTALARKQAEHWFARLSDPASDASERARFARWRDADPCHAAAWHDVEQLWALSSTAITGDPALLAMAEAARQAPASHGHRWLRPALAVAAVLVAVVLLSVWLYRPEVPAGTEYATAIGQRRTIALTDGSTILLDTNSAVRVRFGKAARRVDLIRGRAQFHVHGNAQWPFVVHAGVGTVTDIGTTFQVGLDHNTVDIMLLEGELAIATHADGRTRHADLHTGQALDFDHHGVISPVKSADLKLARGWTRGKLFVHDWPLPKLVETINRYHRTQLVIGDPALRKLHVSGVFHVNDEKSLLLALQAGWSLKVARPDTGHIVLSRQ